MTIPPSSKPKPFRQAAEDYIADKLKAWVRDLTGTPAEPAALEYCRREGFIMPNEGLEAVTALNLFPCVDIAASAEAVANHPETETWAKRAIAAAVADGIREANAGIERIRLGVPEPPQAVLGSGEQEKGMEAALEPPTPLPASGKGIPEAVASRVVRIHEFKVDGVAFYTWDHALIDDVRAAQTQGVTLAVEWESGDWGNRVKKMRVIDP